MTRSRLNKTIINTTAREASVGAQLNNGRRKPVSWLALLAAILILPGCGAPTGPSPPDNLVLICIDTVGARNFFSERIDDALSARLGSAQQYRQASSVSSWTIPAVASTLTGIYPIQHQAGQFQQQPANLKVDLPSALGDSAHTLAEMLAEQGFHARGFSAHPWFSAKFGLEQGFSQINYRRGWQKVTAVFREWLDQLQREAPEQPQRFFAYLHFMEAHNWHLKNRAELDERLAEVSPELRTQLLEDASSAACADPNSTICQRNLVYNLAVRELRATVAAIMSELETRGLLGDTLVMLYSDHGEEFWEHKAEHEQRDDHRKFHGVGHGHSLYQELLHVPLLAWHPGYSGTVRQDLVSLIDVVPTALAWLGIEHDGDPLPGMLLPAGDEPQRNDAAPRTLYASGIAYGSEAIAAREGFLKSILYYPDEHFEYFDLSQDPGERRPVQSDSLTMRSDVLTGDYIDMKKEALAAAPELDSQMLEHLKSIGYLQGVEGTTASEPEQNTAPDSERASGNAGREDSPDS